MPFVEQWLYGPAGGTRGAPRTVLAQSTGLGSAIAAELRRVVDSCGELPVAGLARPALVAVPLGAGAPAVRGRTWGLLRFAAGEAGLVHAIVLGDAEFTAWGRHPLAVAAVFPFLDHWEAGAVLERRALPEAAALPPLTPPPSHRDVALVTEAVRHLLTAGHLRLPLAQPSAESDRALSLILCALPAPLLRDLRFASWAGSEANGWGVAALGQHECAFAGWQRLLLTEVAAIVPDAVEAYAQAVGDCLKAGDLGGLCRLGREQVTVPGVGAPATGSPHRTPERKIERTVIPAALDAPKVPKPPRASRPAPDVPPSGLHPARRGRPGVRFDAEPAAPEARPSPAASPARTRLLRAGRAVGPAGNLRSSRLATLAACGLLAAAAAWWQMPRLTALAGDRFGWFRDEAAPAAETGPSLLRVVDVGAVYKRQLQAVARADAAPGLGAGGQDRRRAQLAFQSEAAGPLLEQVDLFADLAAEGIQQAGRPDRETERLHALDAQGRILEQEMRRLELAWYSLAAGVDWRDVGDLGDGQVAARRDSLKAAAGPALAAASRDVGTAPAWGRMRAARAQMAGMAGLLSGFEAGRWSAEWENELYAAAERVSPSASNATRAYRNSAFALVRLKRAEGSAEARDLPYAGSFGDGQWPAAAVRDVLVELRRQLARFGDAEPPAVLAGTVALYDAFERAGSLAAGADAAAALAALERNPAVVFDPGRYTDYLERLRYEAVCASLATDSTGAAVPAGLADSAQLAAVVRFRASLQQVPDEPTWRAEAATQADPFLGRWAQRQALSAAAGRQQRLEAFDARWRSCAALSAAVDAQAAQGRDWTAAWCDLREQTIALLDDYARVTGGDPDLAARVERAARLLRRLDAPRSLRLTSVTVRLGPGGLAAPADAEVRLEAVGLPGPLVSAPLRLGPAAPAGSGWVGNVALDWRVPVGPNDALTVRVFDRTGRELLQAAVPALAERAGPGALVRPRGGDQGSVTFQLDPGWWSGLRLQDSAAGM